MNLSSIKTEDLLTELEYRLGNGEELPFKGNTGIIHFAFRTLQIINDAINSKVINVEPNIDDRVRLAIKDIKRKRSLCYRNQ